MHAFVLHPNASSGLAGAVSRTATAPIDRLKMLLQVQESQHLTLRQGLRMMASEGGAAATTHHRLNAIECKPFIEQQSSRNARARLSGSYMPSRAASFDAAAVSRMWGLLAVLTNNTCLEDINHAWQKKLLTCTFS